jgi:hypothetical protein
MDYELATSVEKKTLCNSVNLRVTLCQKIVTQSCTEKTQSYTEKKNAAPLRLKNKNIKKTTTKQ